MQVYSFSGKGKRKVNEDYIVNLSIGKNTSLHIVADGMGGYQYGEVAAKITAESIAQTVAESLSCDINIVHLLQHSVEIANDLILTQRQNLHAKLGTTIGGVLIKENSAYAFWLGDVQIQLFRNNMLLFQSEHHSLLNEMKKNGVVSAKDIERYQNIVTKSLSGSSFEQELPVVKLELKPSDIIIISSDGFYNSVNSTSMKAKSDIEIETELNTIIDTNNDNFSVIRLII